MLIAVRVRAVSRVQLTNSDPGMGGRMMRVLKGVEELGRRSLFNALLTASRRQSSVEPGELSRQGRRVLFIAEDAVGDTLLSMPAIRAIAEAHPNNIVDVATWPAAACLFENVPYVRRTIVFPRYDKRRRHAFQAVRRHGPYDAVVDGMVLRRHVRSRSLAMMLGSGARFWIGEKDRGSDYVLNVPTPRPDDATTHLDRMLGFATPFGCADAPRRPHLVTTPAERLGARSVWNVESRALRILVNLSTNGPERRWDPTRFAGTIAHLRRRRPGASIVIVALERDRLLAEFVASAAGEPGVHLPTLRGLIALVESADLIVSPDTSVCHMASAFRRPLVSLHNAGKEQWGPYETPGVRVIAPEVDTLDGIAVRDVTAAIDRVLNEMVLRAGAPLPSTPFEARAADLAVS